MLSYHNAINTKQTGAMHIVSTMLTDQIKKNIRHTKKSGSDNTDSTVELHRPVLR